MKLGIVQDLVCGTELPQSFAVERTEYKGNTYYFCSKQDWKRFKRDPDRYVDEAAVLTALSPEDRSPKQENL